MKMKWLKRSIPFAVAFVVIGAVVALLVGYFRFISAQIREDGQRHLKEVYGQVNHSFQSLLEKNWGFLECCHDHLILLTEGEGKEEQEIASFIEDKKQYWGFTDFYFLTADKRYRSIDGKEGTVKLENASETLINEKKPIMAGETLGGQKLTMFAIAAEGTYDGFRFDAVGVSYTNTDMATALNADAFEGEAECYVIRPDGGVLLSTAVGGGTMLNYFEYLSGMIPEETIAAIQSDLTQGKEGFFQSKIGGETRSIIYMPIGYEDYALLSDVPQTSLSQGFLLAQRATMRVLLIIFSIVIVGLLVILVLRIVSQSRRSKKEIIYRERMFSVLSSSVNDIFLMLDPETQRVDYISPNIERLLGIKAADAQKNIRLMATCAVDRDIIVPDSVLRAIPIGGEHSWECEYMHQATGERRWYRVSIYHMDVDKMEKYVIVMSDRTLDRQLNQKLQEALDAAKSANEAKSNFLSNMSHDIRTPMNAIVGFTVLLERNAEDVELVRDYTRKIMASSHHLLSLINDVLDMSKIESGKTSLNVDMFSLPDLLEELKITVMPQAKAKQQEFTIHTQGNPPERLMGDRLRLNQILLNLLSNAVKYTQVGGKIEFTVQEIPDTAQYTKLRFIVKDNGIGMSEDYIKEIFLPFSREKNSVVNKIQGTGLGMAITKNLVDLMGGIIQVESEPNKGSVFTVELSFAPMPEELPDTWYRAKIRRMLVADDEEEICLNIREMMRGTGVDVSYTTDGSDAVQVALHAEQRGDGFDVILLDWKMPDMDGIETARAIREKIGTHIPILVLTSYDWGEIEAEAREAGISAFMPKPFFASTFFSTVRPLFAEVAPPKKETQYEDALKGKLFLVAEDNELNAEILTEMLHIEGAECEVAPNGKCAVEMFEASEAGKYDLIFMDVQMPVMNGYEATRAIRASSRPDGKTIPIVAMTANTYAEDVKSALDAGMNAHLAKPIDMDAVRRTVAEILGKGDDK